MFQVVSICVLVAAAQAPDSAAAWLQQARMAYSKAQFSQARLAAHKALEANPRATDAELILGLIDLRELKTDTAYEHLMRVVELKPDNVSAHYNLGIIELLRKRPSSALPHFEAVRRSNAADVPALVAILECYIALSEARRITETTDTLNEVIGSDPAVLNRVAGMLVSRGQYAPAIPLLKRLRDAARTSFERAYNLSVAYFRTGQLADAAAALEPWTGSNANAQALSLLGVIHEKAGRYPQAIGAVERAVRLAPSNEDFRIDYGSILVEAGRLDEASSVFRDATRDFPQSLRARLGLGSAYYLAGRYDLAARSLLDAVPVAPGSAAVYALLGRTFDSVPGMQDEIRGVFDAYLQRHPRDGEAYARYGEMLQAAGRTADAKQSVVRALEIEPKLAEAHLQLGAILQREGDLAGAAKSLERAVELASDHAGAHYRLATVYQKLGRASDGRRELERFQQLKAEQANRERELVMRAVAAAK